MRTKQRKQASIQESTQEMNIYDKLGIDRGKEQSNRILESTRQDDDITTRQTQGERVRGMDVPE